MAEEITHSLVQNLRRVPDLAEVDDASLLDLVGASANLVWTNGAEIFSLGAPARALYLVLSGAVDVIDETGETVRTVGPGEYVGERALLRDANHSKTARAAARSELMVVPKDSFTPLLDAHPELAAGVRRRLDRPRPREADRG